MIKKILFSLFSLMSLGTFAQEELSIPIGYNADKSDVLLLSISQEDNQLHSIWKGDTLASDWTYASIHQTVSHLSAVGLYQTFVIQGHAGDGCPTTYRIIALKPDGDWFVSDPFGNCDAFSEMSIKGNKLTFGFAAVPSLNRKKLKVVYDAGLFKLDE